MSTQAATVSITLQYSITNAIRLLHSKLTSPTEYESILKEILQTGYDINSNQSELLLCALNATSVNADIVILLFSLGAQVASAHGVYISSAYSHAFNACRRYSHDIAKALFDHIMASPHFDLIAAHLRDNRSRFDVFRDLASDDDKAALYVRIKQLPSSCSSIVQAICAKSGLVYPPHPLTPDEEIAKLKEQLAAETSQTISLKEQLAAVSATFEKQLAAETESMKEKLDKATAIITKLTSL